MKYDSVYNRSRANQMVQWFRLCAGFKPSPCLSKQGLAWFFWDLSKLQQSRQLPYDVQLHPHTAWLNCRSLTHSCFPNSTLGALASTSPYDCLVAHLCSLTHSCKAQSCRNEMDVRQRCHTLGRWQAVSFKCPWVDSGVTADKDTAVTLISIG